MPATSRPDHPYMISCMGMVDTMLLALSSAPLLSMSTIPVNLVTKLYLPELYPVAISRFLELLPTAPPRPFGMNMPFRHIVLGPAPMVARRERPPSALPLLFRGTQASLAFSPAALSKLLPPPHLNHNFCCLQCAHSKKYMYVCL